MGTADAQKLADAIVDTVIREHKVERPNGGSGSTFAEYRTRSSAGEHSFADSYGAT